MRSSGGARMRTEQRRRWRDAGGPGDYGTLLPQRDGRVRAVRGLQPGLLAARLSRSSPQHFPLRRRPPDRPTDPPGLRRAVHRLRAVPEGEPSLRHELQRPRQRLPALCRPGEALHVRGAWELKLIFRNEGKVFPYSGVSFQYLVGSGFPPLSPPLKNKALRCGFWSHDACLQQTAGL